MSKYLPPEVALLDSEIAGDPALALEFKAYVSSELVTRIGDLNIPAADSGVLEMSRVGEAVIDAEPSDLQLAVRDQLNSAVAPVIVFNVTDEDDDPTTAEADFTPPSWVENDSFDYQAGYAVDLVTANGKKIKSIDGIASVTGGARGSKLRIFKLPDRDTFKLVGFCTDRDFSTKSRPAENIPDQADGSASVKRGRSAPGELNLSQKFGTFGDGLSRVSGKRCTVMLELEKDDKVITDRLVFGNYIGAVKPSAGDGSDHATSRMEGSYEHLAVFVAK
jgi:hypothetical protein